MIGIVGGGISGLFVLHLLRERGVDATLFESENRPGGVMRGWTVPLPGGGNSAGGGAITGGDFTSAGEIPIDAGPQRMRLTSGLARVVEAAGLTPSLLYVQGREPFTMVWKGEMHFAPMSFGAALRTSLISWPGKVRALADLVTPAPRPEESVAEVLTRKLGPEIYERLAGPILGGLYGSEPEAMPAKHTLLAAMRRTGAKRSLLSALRRAARFDSLPTVSFKEGLGALPHRLAEMHRDRVRLGMPVARLEGRSGGGFVIEAAQERVAVERVVLTLPAPAAGRLLGSIAPDAGTRLAGLRYNPLAVVHLLLPEGAATPPMGSGFKATLRDPMLTRGVTAHGALFGEGSGRERLYVAFLGGMGREEVATLPEEDLADRARADFLAVTGVDPIPLAVHRTAMPAWDRSWDALEGLELPDGIDLCAAFSDRPGIPGRLEEARRLVERIAPE